MSASYISGNGSLSCDEGDNSVEHESGESMDGSESGESDGYIEASEGSECGEDSVLGVRPKSRLAVLSVPVQEDVSLRPRRLWSGCTCCWCQAASAGWLSVQTARLILSNQEHLESFADLDNWEEFQRELNNMREDFMDTNQYSSSVKKARR